MRNCQHPAIRKNSPNHQVRLGSKRVLFELSLHTGKVMKIIGQMQGLCMRAWDQREAEILLFQVIYDAN